MKTKRTYITPVTKYFSLRIEKIMQDDLVVFSGGAPGEGISIDPNGDGSDNGNRSDSWTNHLWED